MPSFFVGGLHRSLFLSDTCDHLGDGSSHTHILQKILPNDKLFSVTLYISYIFLIIAFLTGNRQNVQICCFTDTCLVLECFKATKNLTAPSGFYSIVDTRKEWRIQYYCMHQ